VSDSDRAGFLALVRRLGDAWTAGDAAGAADCFSERVDDAGGPEDKGA